METPPPQHDLGDIIRSLDALLGTGADGAAVERWLATHCLSEVERATILAHLKVHAGNRVRTADSLKMAIRTLGLRLSKWGMTRRLPFMGHKPPPPPDVPGDPSSP